VRWEIGYREEGEMRMKIKMKREAEGLDEAAEQWFCRLGV
jgi:hypothetical protein